MSNRLMVILFCVNKIYIGVTLGCVGSHSVGSLEIAELALKEEEVLMA